MRLACLAYSSLYIPSQSMGAAKEEETRCSGEAVPLLLLLSPAVATATAPPPAAAGATGTLS